MGIKMFKTPEELQSAWEDYKHSCDCRRVVRTEFSPKLGKFCTQDVPSSVTYTIEGFCVHVHLARSAFYKHYDGTKRYQSVVDLMREECEVDAREKFETGVLPAQLAGLWMSRHGYTTKTEVHDESAQKKSMDNIESMVKQLSEVEDDDVAE